MKNVLFNSVLVAFVLLVASCGKQPEAKVEVMSFNIRLDHVADSMNNWKYRKDNAAQMIAYCSGHCGHAGGGKESTQ